MHSDDNNEEESDNRLSDSSMEHSSNTQDDEVLRVKALTENKRTNVQQSKVERLMNKPSVKSIVKHTSDSPPKKSKNKSNLSVNGTKQGRVGRVADSESSPDSGTTRKRKADLSSPESTPVKRGRPAGSKKRSASHL